LRHHTGLDAHAIAPAAAADVEKHG
jgi:hypothetical protein